MKKRVIATLMASLMVISTAACGGSGGSDGTSAQNAPAATASGTASDSSSKETSQATDTASEEAPKEYEEATLSAFIQQSVTGESGEWVGWGAKKLYDDVKLKIDFDPTGDEIDQKLQAYREALEFEKKTRGRRASKDVS